MTTMLKKRPAKTDDDMMTIVPQTPATIAQMRVTVVGIKPLLTHNPESMGLNTEAKRGSRVPDAEVEAEQGTYRLPDGSCAIKGESFRASLLGAAGAWKEKRSTMKSKLSHCIVIEDLVQLQHSDGTPITDYVIDARRAIIQKQGIIRRRPKFNDWKCTFTIEFDPVLVPNPQYIVNILIDAGNRIGVGDYRPARNGPFGRFAVREFKVTE